MTLRTATVDDLADIMDLERASFPTDAWSEPMMREELLSPHAHYLVDVEAGRLLAYGGVRAVARAADADIQTITVAASARGRGRGDAAAGAAGGSAAARGARGVPRGACRQPDRRRAVRLGGFLEIARRPATTSPTTWMPSS
jgi:ribosomal protein S18 acetylase RimI-like enzyme